MSTIFIIYTMNIDAKKEILSRIEEIMKISFPLCKNSNLEVSAKNTKINNLAYEIKALLPKIKND